MGNEWRSACAGIGSRISVPGVAFNWQRLTVIRPIERAHISCAIANSTKGVTQLYFAIRGIRHQMDSSDRKGSPARHTAYRIPCAASVIVITSCRLTDMYIIRSARRDERICCSTHPTQWLPFFLMCYDDRWLFSLFVWRVCCEMDFIVEMSSMKSLGVGSARGWAAFSRVVCRVCEGIGYGCDGVVQ